MSPRTLSCRALSARAALRGAGRRIAMLVVLLAGSLAAGCASDRVVLLPNADGHASKLVVQHGATQTELAAPYAAVSVSSAGRPTRSTASEADVDKQFGALLAAMPVLPVSYVMNFATDAIDAASPEAQAELRRALQDIAGRAAPEVTIIGHTDAVGDLEYNDKLSLERAAVIAEQVRQRLRSLKLDAQQVDVAGRGEREPLAAVEGETAEQQNARNRRVEINVR